MSLLFLNKLHLEAINQGRKEHRICHGIVELVELKK